MARARRIRKINSVELAETRQRLVGFEADARALHREFVRNIRRGTSKAVIQRRLNAVHAQMEKDHKKLHEHALSIGISPEEIDKEIGAQFDRTEWTRVFWHLMEIAGK
jgi:hypothetical protein